jgi:mycoredoxin
MPELYTTSPSDIILYGVSWCGDCRRTRQVLAEKEITYIDVDVDRDNTAAEFVKKINRGFRSVPTLVFPDGTTLTEPDNDTLLKKLEMYIKTA